MNLKIFLYYVPEISVDILLSIYTILYPSYLFQRQVTLYQNKQINAVDWKLSHFD